MQQNADAAGRPGISRLSSAWLVQTSDPRDREESSSLYCTRMSGSQIAQRDRRDEMVMGFGASEVQRHFPKV